MQFSNHRRKLPPLQGLVVLDAVSRHRSFTDAADELSVTQSAVSRQIRLLEQYLGRRLFSRQHRGVSLTPFGERYQTKITQALDLIEQAQPHHTAEPVTRIVTLNIMQSLAVLWLLPYLSEFRRAHPSIELRLITSMSPVNLEDGETDIAIRLGQLPGQKYPEHAPQVDFKIVENWHLVHAEALAPDILTPICAPSLLTHGGQSRPDAGRDYCLLHNINRPNCWPDWFRAQGHPMPRGGRNQYYGHFFTAIEAAQEGHGFAIVPDILLTQATMDGLTAPFRPCVESAGGYYLLCANSKKDEPYIKAIFRWLKTRAQDTPETL